MIQKVAAFYRPLAWRPRRVSLPRLFCLVRWEVLGVLPTTYNEWANRPVIDSSGW